MKLMKKAQKVSKNANLQYKILVTLKKANVPPKESIVTSGKLLRTCDGHTDGESNHSFRHGGRNGNKMPRIFLRIKVE